RACASPGPSCSPSSSRSAQRFVGAGDLSTGTMALNEADARRRSRNERRTPCQAGEEGSAADLPSPAELTPPKRLRRLEADFAKAGGRGWQKRSAFRP